MLSKVLAGLLLMLIGAPTAFAQTFEGYLRNQFSAPIENAYIIVQNSSEGRHAHTNALGYFSLSNSRPGEVIFISHLGYENKTVVLTDSMLNSPVDITLRQSSIDLDQVVISNQVTTLQQISAVDIENNPVKSSQEILRKIPGLFIGQHAGGGKAEQIFLRGFDIDHGTDIKISVDGLPVNMVSHAHGQGYADLHFVIPETIEKVDYGKGPYYAEHGNFTTAGYVSFETKEALESSKVQLEYGRFQTMRLLGMLNLLGNKINHNAFIAGEYLATDGPFQSPQNFNRINLQGKFTSHALNNQKIGIGISYFTSKWDASGQIPQRAVDSGLIGRFGAIDDTEGGTTSRMNVHASHLKYLHTNATIQSKFYYSRYLFELYSNFTFFLEDPVNGDQIRQKEIRDIFGFESKVIREWDNDLLHTVLRGGIQLRYDKVSNNELSRTLNRKTTLEPLALGTVYELNAGLFADAAFHLGDWTIRPSLRADFFKFEYIDLLDSLYVNRSTTKGNASPKLEVLYSPVKKWQLYVKSGMGFHSNDTRVITAQTGRDILPYAIGVDAGANWKPTTSLYFNTAFWYLYLQQEFVYVGDGGIVEPSGKTRRLGLDLSARYQPFEWLFLNIDVNYSFARAIGEPEGADRIPLAPDLTSTGGITVKTPFGLSSSLNYRYLRSRPANEDNSIVAKGYFISDLTINYERKRWYLGIAIENLFNADWNETQFATESRLDFESEPVEEIHFTPGTPLFIKGFIGITF